MSLFCLRRPGSQGADSRCRRPDISSDPSLADDGGAPRCRTPSCPDDGDVAVSVGPEKAKRMCPATRSM
jgi:hypothetical protein